MSHTITCKNHPKVGICYTKKDEPTNHKYIEVSPLALMSFTHNKSKAASRDMVKGQPEKRLFVLKNRRAGRRLKSKYPEVLTPLSPPPPLPLFNCIISPQTLIANTN